MKPEEYFDFEEFETPHGKGARFRLKGHRIDIEHVLNFVNQGYSPERIVTEVYPTLDVDKVRACIDFYRESKERVDQAVASSERIGEAYYQEYLKKPVPPVVERLRALKAAKDREARERNGET
jgi:uncharacterized protein (DUF433 family)